MKVKLDKVMGVIRESDEAALGGSFVYGYDNDTAVTSGANQFRQVILNQDNASYTYPANGFTQMPCHGKVRPCVMSDCAERTVAYYLNPSDITKKVDGTASKLDGTDGDVMVEFEPCYYRIDQYTDDNSHLHEVFLMSVDQFPGAAYWPGFYIGPGGATVRKQYVGMYQGYITGGKLHSWSGVQPTVSKSCAQFITAGVANGGNQVNDLMFQWIFHLMITELASCDSQTAVSTGHVNNSSWNAAFVRKTGRADYVPYKGGVLADDAGVDSDLASNWNSGAAHVIACKYAYIENLWGSVWENCAGYQKYQDDTEIDITVNSVKYYRYEDGDYPSGEGVTRTAFAWKSEGGTVIYTAAAHPAVNNATYSDTALETSTGYTISAFDEDFTQSGYWFTTDTAKYSQLTSNRDPGPENSAFPAAGCTPDSIAWVSHNWPKAEGWPSKWDARTLFPTNASGGAAGTGLTDYFYNNVQGGARALFRGGHCGYGSKAGFGSVHVNSAVGYAHTSLGGRLSA